MRDGTYLGIQPSNAATVLSFEMAMNGNHSPVVDISIPRLSIALFSSRQFNTSILQAWTAPRLPRLPPPRQTPALSPGW